MLSNLSHSQLSKINLKNYKFGEKSLFKGKDKAPEFTLPDQDENLVSLADFKGNKVVLWFYPKASTPG